MTDTKDTHVRSDDPAELADRPKKVYQTPRLIVHGTLQEITRNVGNGFVDFPNGSSIAG
ncbi:MAG: lasso RiPP family leader peptide-containing protein [Bacteroidetes bacterium]|nr:lasso RiPP family leader peptide-containing protein [Bacteroidota bacterium]